MAKLIASSQVYIDIFEHDKELYAAFITHAKMRSALRTFKRIDGQNYIQITDEEKTVTLAHVHDELMGIKNTNFAFKDKQK